MAGLTATVALDFFVLSALLVAVTVTFVELPTLGAVNIPLLETLPALEDQLTAVLLVPWTVAENCCVFPDDKFALLGVTETLTVDADGLTATVALAFLLVSAALVAVTVTFVVALTLGATNIPPLEMDPALADQLTVVLVVPDIVAANCLLFPEVKLVLVGEIVTLTEPDAPDALTIVMEACNFAVLP